MFLFDKYRSSRQSYNTGNKVSLRWKTFLNTKIPYGAESTADIDEEGNLYFGSHSGNFYSLSPDGKIRWTFSARKKIYNSPILFDNSVCFADGEGTLFCLSQDNGEIKWKFDLTSGYKENKLTHFINKLFTYSVVRRVNMDTKCWSSAILLNDRIFITAYGKGAYCLEKNGKVLWSLDLGYPRYQLSGMVADNDDRLYFASRKGNLYSVTTDGKVLWTKRFGFYYNVWGNPSIDDYHNIVFVPLSRGEKKGWVAAYTTDGVLKWKTRLTGAVYGSISIDYNREYIYVGDFEGFLYKIEATTGNIVDSVRLCNTARALWATPTIDGQGYIYIGVKDNIKDGRVIKLDSSLRIIWEYSIGKTLSVPVILKNGDVCAGSWDGSYYCLKTY